MEELILQAEPSALYPWLKGIHVLGLVLYAGGLLAVTRWLGHAVRFESTSSRADAYRVCRRMHLLVDWTGLVLMLGAGVWLVVADPMGKDYLRRGYFHLKLTCAVVLVLCDVFLSRRLFRLQGEGAQPGAAFFKVVHGMAGLALLGALLAVFVLRG